MLRSSDPCASSCLQLFMVFTRCESATQLNGAKRLHSLPRSMRGRMGAQACEKGVMIDHGVGKGIGANSLDNHTFFTK